MRRMRPAGHDAARANVYPQKGPYVRYARKRPDVKPPVYKRTIKGKKFVEHKPRAQERAWTGGLDRGPIRNQSATGTIRNTYSQRGKYVAYYQRRGKSKTPSYNNREQVSRVRRYSRAPRTGGAAPRFYPSSRTKSYVQRGRKNVYWGKYQKKEQAVTTDITGGPLRTRNYKSPAIGLVGRDTLAYFGRKPSEDRGRKPTATGYRTTGRASRGWKGDVAGWPVRSPRDRRDNYQGPLTPTQPGIGGWWLSKVFNKKFKGVKPKDRVPSTPESRYTGNIPLYDKDKSFTDGGAGYAGNIKGGRAGFSRTGSGLTKGRRPSNASRKASRYSGNMNRGDVRGYSSDFIRYSGTMPRSALSEFSISGFGYKGFIKRSQLRGFNTEYAGYSGNIRRGGRGMSPQGANYSGNLRRLRGFDTGYAGYSGNLPRSAAAKQFEEVGYGYYGFQKRSIRGFADQGEGGLGKTRTPYGRGFVLEGTGFAGNLRAKRRAKGGGSISGMWNNDESPLGKTPPVSMGGADFSGRSKTKRPAKGGGSISFRLWNNDESPLGKTPPVSMAGADFSGRSKTKRPAKGGGSISFRLWNNDESPLGKTPPVSMAGADFSGRSKTKRPAKGGGSISFRLWNNDESPLGKTPPASLAGVDYSGRSKARRPEKGGGSASGNLWNNRESALSKSPPVTLAGLDFSGRTKAKRPEKGGGSVSGVLWNNNQSALSKTPPANAGAAAGLQVRVKEARYSRKEKASRDALPGIAPTRSSVKASEYSRNMKMYWNYKHNPLSSRYALKTIGPGKAEARMRDYQGNAKMRKYNVSGQHPDAKFAHTEGDNVKGERGLITNVKLFWEKMFNKSGTQPTNVKDKGKKIQYDKREKGLWAY